MNNFRKILIALIPFKNTGKQKTYNRKKADQNQWKPNYNISEYAIDYFSHVCLLYTHTRIVIDNHAWNTTYCRNPHKKAGCVFIFEIPLSQHKHSTEKKSKIHDPSGSVSRRPYCRRKSHNSLCCQSHNKCSDQNPRCPCIFSKQIKQKSESSNTRQ